MTDPASDSTPAKQGTRKLVMLLLKVAFSVAALWLIFSKVVGRDGADNLWARLKDLQWQWVVAAIVMQLVAIAFSTVRWQRLLVGQGIHASWRFLSGSVMIARFWGAFTPGGFTGFGGWRIFDVAQHTGKTARAAATIGTEMILGQMAFGVVVMAGSIFGFRFIGLEGVVLVNLFFVGLIAAGIFVLTKPDVVRIVARMLPGVFEPRVQTLVDAVCAYKGKTALLIQAAFLGMGTHAFNNLIYVCAAQALGVELGVGEIFFGSSLQIFSTLLPTSINGIGLREATAVALYTSVGVALELAVLIPIVGFACEMVVSACGGFIFLARRTGYQPKIRVDEVDREQQRWAAVEQAPPESWPKVIRGTTLGAAAGLLAGVLVGLGEGLLVLSAAGWQHALGVLSYGAALYGTFCLLGGAATGFAFAVTGRWRKRRALAESQAYGYIVATFFAAFSLILGAFRVRRDVFAEELKWKSPQGIAVFLGCALAAALTFFILSKLIGWLASKPYIRRGTDMTVTAVFACTVLGLAYFGAQSRGQAEAEDDLKISRTVAPELSSAGPVLFIVVDTLRADHLPSYGYEGNKTPHLDAFASDAVRFDQFFANASWTRPSFASFLTGRFPSNHGVMEKASALADSLVTLPEALAAKGFATLGIATNHNLHPSFNLDQGFDTYAYLPPNYMLGAADEEAKLLFYQVLRRLVEKVRGPQPGEVYQDAHVVNARLLDWIDAAPQERPWFAFVGYMDPHDPYFDHEGPLRGYSRAANQNPRAEEAPHLINLYDGEIRYWDEAFGALIADLKKREIYEDMTIIVTSDHGEEFGDHGGFWHGTTLYDEQVHVPFFVKLPKGKRAGTVVRHWAQSVDVMPTLLAELGLPIPPGIQGGNFFEGTERVYAEESHEGNVLESLRHVQGGQERKLITANTGNPRGLELEELYAVDVDRDEKDNLAEQRKDELARMRAELVKSSKAAKEGATDAQRATINAELANQLESLGYMQK